MFSEIMRYILDLGPTVMLPIVIIIFSKLLGMKLGDCFKSGLHIGIGFVGIGLVIGLMLDSIGPAAKAMAEHFQINLHVIDIGWPGSSPMTGRRKSPSVAIPVAIAVNIVMLVTRMTRVVNVDIWNIWHMTFTGAMLHIATGSYWIGILGVVVHAAFVYKLGDWFAKDTRDFFGLEGIAIPHGSSAYLGPVAVLVDTIIDKIPGLNRIHFSADDIQKRFGPFGEPVTVGFVMGLVIGALAGYDLKGILQLAVKTAAVMLLMPRVIKPIMDGLTPIAKQARKRLQAKFGGRGIPDWSRSGAAARSYLGSLGQPDFHPADHSYRRRGPWQPRFCHLVTGHHRLLRSDGSGCTSGQSVPHVDFRGHHYGNHPVDRHPDHWPAHPAGGKRRGPESRRHGGLNGPGWFADYLGC